MTARDYELVRHNGKYYFEFHHEGHLVRVAVDMAVNDYMRTKFDYSSKDLESVSYRTVDGEVIVTRFGYKATAVSLDMLAKWFKEERVLFYMMKEGLE